MFRKKGFLFLSFEYLFGHFLCASHLILLRAQGFTSQVMDPITVGLPAQMLQSNRALPAFPIKLSENLFYRLVGMGGLLLS